MKSSENEHYKFLEEKQCELDNEYIAHAKREFDLNLEHFNKINPILLDRDLFIKEKTKNGIFSDFWKNAFLNYDIGLEILPTNKNNEFDSSWIDYIRVEYLQDYTCYVRIELKENDYVENNVLEKKIYLAERDVETTTIKYKMECKFPIFTFFESEDEEYEIFDILYELYINAIFYYSLDIE